MKIKIKTTTITLSFALVMMTIFAACGWAERNAFKKDMEIVKRSYRQMQPKINELKGAVIHYRCTYIDHLEKCVEFLPLSHKDYIYLSRLKTKHNLRK